MVLYIIISIFLLISLLYLIVKKRFIGAVIIIACLLGMYFLTFRPPDGVRHLKNVATVPDLHKPIAQKELDITQDAIVFADLEIPLNDEYSVGFRPVGNYLPSDYEFNGTCSVKIIKKGKIIKEAIANSSTAQEYRIYDDDLNLHTDKVSLVTFDSGDLKIDGKKVTIEIRLLDEDAFAEVEKPVKFYIGIDKLL
ncbi:hypothetical protein [Sedimentisphaera salicampi]|uniref:Uncharacterized protein n=1 Tax=Sedimentisphaera salicampi TaxID=1941349 RepID=A0A1W6LMG8_9BACT|nr:hypothetical protein [Sedimentisphaera salicampi]ARN56990.1 hypothetical protein STSP1_01383 [Sedimentisphaera salicampi]